MNILLSTSLCVHPYFAFRIFSGPQHRQNMQPNQGSKVRGTEDQEQQASFMSRNVFYPGVKTRGCDLRPGCFKFQPSVIILRLSLLQMNAGFGFLVWILPLVNFSPFFPAQLTMHYGIRAMEAMSIRISELCLSFSPHANISDGKGLAPFTYTVKL